MSQSCPTGTNEEYFLSLQWVLPAAKPAGHWIIIHLLSITQMKAFRAQESVATYVIEVTESNSEVICSLRGDLEAENGQKLSETILPKIWRAKTAPCSVAQWLGRPTVDQKDQGSILALGKNIFSFFMHC